MNDDMKGALVLDYYGLLPNRVHSLSFKCLCPFHAEYEESMNVGLENEIFFCFGCGAKGDFIDLISKIEKVDRLQAMIKYHRITKDSDNVDFTEIIQDKKSYKKLLKKAKKYFNRSSSWREVNGEVREYLLDERGFDARTLNEFNVKINRKSIYPVIIPVIEQGEFRGYIQRRIDEEGSPKYLYNKGFRKNQTLGGDIKKGAVMVVEGITDLMRAWQFGFKNVVTIFGWSISDYQAEKLDEYGEVIISALDDERAGKKGSEKLKEKFPDRYIRFQFPKNNDISDVADIFNKDIFDFSLDRTRDEYFKKF